MAVTWERTPQARTTRCGGPCYTAAALKPGTPVLVIRLATSRRLHYRCLVCAAALYPEQPMTEAMVAAFDDQEERQAIVADTLAVPRWTPRAVSRPARSAGPTGTGSGPTPFKDLADKIRDRLDVRMRQSGESTGDGT